METYVKNYNLWLLSWYIERERERQRVRQRETEYLEMGSDLEQANPQADLIDVF